MSIDEKLTDSHKIILNKLLNGVYSIYAHYFVLEVTTSIAFKI